MPSDVPAVDTKCDRLADTDVHKTIFWFEIQEIRKLCVVVRQSRLTTKGFSPLLSTSVTQLFIISSRVDSLFCPPYKYHNPTLIQTSSPDKTVIPECFCRGSIITGTPQLSRSPTEALGDDGFFMSSRTETPKISTPCRNYAFMKLQQI